jgi:hypothetical protein
MKLLTQCLIGKSTGEGVERPKLQPICNLMSVDSEPPLEPGVCVVVCTPPFVPEV